MQGKQKPKLIQPEKLIGSRPRSNKSMVNDRDSMLYALSIGFSKDPLREQDYKYTNEFNENFTIFPTMGVIVPQGNLVKFLNEHEDMPKFLDFSVLHLQQKITLIKQKIEIGVQYENERELIDVSDKGKNAFMKFRTKSYCMSNKGIRQLAFENQSVFYFKDLGGFKYPGNGSIQPIVQIPQRSCDIRLTAQTYLDQAFLYRLNLDRNPLHIDPKLAKSLKFQRPIIHGLASFGTIGRVFVQQVFNNDPTRLKSFRCNFVGHIYPGESLDIQVWKDNHKFIFKATVRQRKTVALKGEIERRQSPKL